MPAYTRRFRKCIFLSWLFHFLGISVQSLSCVRLFATPWTVACQYSLSITNSQNLLKLMSMELVMPSNHLILCRPLLLLPSVFLSIRVFSSESVLRIRWPKYWSFSFSISPSNEYSELVSFRIDWFVIFLNFRNLPLGNSQRCVNYKNYNERTCACQQYYMYR